MWGGSNEVTDLFRTTIRLFVVILKFEIILSSSDSLRGEPFPIKTFFFGASHLIFLQQNNYFYLLEQGHNTFFYFYRITHVCFLLFLFLSDKIVFKITSADSSYSAPSLNEVIPLQICFIIFETSLFAQIKINR